MAPATTEVLAGVPLLAELTQRELRSLTRRLREHNVKAGDDVVTEGKGGAAFFIIAAGEARVRSGRGKAAKLGPGDYFGEMSLIDGGPRTATVTAVSDLALLGLSSWDFRPFVEENPSVAWKLLKVLVGRIRAADGPR